MIAGAVVGPGWAAGKEQCVRSAEPYDAADTGAGTELSEAVSAALPEVVAAVRAELPERHDGGT